MTVQRYYSTSNMGAARRSFVVGSLLGVAINLMLVTVGLAVLYYYFGQDIPPDRALDPAVRAKRDLIFPVFAVERLPAGLGGGILAALLAAAMSSIDSGINSLATVLSVEIETRERRTAERTGAPAPARDHVRRAKRITLIAGFLITIAAWQLDYLPKQWGIVDGMPRTFNAITGPLGGLFLIGMLIPRAGGRAAVTATLCGLATSIGIGYSTQIVQLLAAWGFLQSPAMPPLSFTLVMPCSLLVTLATAALLAPFDRSRKANVAGLTWQTRHQPAPGEVR